MKLFIFQQNNFLVNPINTRRIPILVSSRLILIKKKEIIFYCEDSSHGMNFNVSFIFYISLHTVSEKTVAVLKLPTSQK